MRNKEIENPYERLQRYMEEAQDNLIDSEEGTEDYWYYNGMVVAYEHAFEIMGHL